jgi:hypothetical protein
VPNHYTITIDDTGESYRCADDRSVLAGMEALGKKGIPGGLPQRRLRRVQGAGARGQLHQARDEPRPRQRAGRGQGCVLSCRVTPTSDLRIRVLGTMKKTVCRPATPTGTFPFDQPETTKETPWQ